LAAGDRSRRCCFLALAEDVPGHPLDPCDQPDEAGPADPVVEADAAEHGRRRHPLPVGQGVALGDEVVAVPAHHPVQVQAAGLRPADHVAEAHGRGGDRHDEDEVAVEQRGTHAAAAGPDLHGDAVPQEAGGQLLAQAGRDYRWSGWAMTKLQVTIASGSSSR
jgi:hypothetical protein